MSETFDTLGAARQLQAASMERPHAEAVADVVRDSRDGLATQVGLDALRREMKTGMDALSERIQGLNDRIDTIRWMIGLLFVMKWRLPLMHMAPVARVCHQMLRLRLGRGNG